MTRLELEQLKKLACEARLLEEELQNLPMAKDSVRGSMIEHPYIEVTIPIKGIDEENGIALRNKLETKLARLQEAVKNMEDWLDHIEDSEMRTILRLKYRNGMTQEEIGSELGYSERTILRRIKEFWKEKE